MSFSSGMTPASESLVALTMIMNRMVVSPPGFKDRFAHHLDPARPLLHRHDDRSSAKPTHPANFFCRQGMSVGFPGRFASPCAGLTTRIHQKVYAKKMDC